jgi:DNA repair exonuclease SbcCD nuclease subunit
MKQIVFSDSHLGYRQYGLLRRENDFEKSVSQIIKQIIADPDVHHAFHAGDFLNVKRPTSKTIQFVADMDEQLINAKKTLHVISGNHDFCDPPWIDTVKTTASRNSPYGIKCFDYGRVEDDGKVFLGLPEMSKDEYIKTFEKLEEGYALFIHAPIKEFIKYPSDHVLAVDDLPTDKFTFIFVGDTHVTECISKDNCNVISPGSTELCSSSEPPEKVFFEIAHSTYVKKSIESRKVYTLDISTEEELETFLGDHKFYEAKEALVFVNYDSLINNALDRIFLTFDTDKVILRLRAIHSQIKAKDKTKKYACVSTNPKDYIEMFAEKDKPEHGLLTRLLEDKETAADVVDAYIDERTTELAV